MAASTVMRASRPYDVLIYGCTGFTGRLVAEYFARSVPSTVKWALAGRSRDKIEQVRKQVGRDDVGIVVASAEDAASLDEMARQARCVLTTVGPFSLYGEPLVRACARNGTDYVDTTGETTFVADMIRAYHDQARANGAIIVSMCGFDSIPADLGTYFVVDHIRRVYHVPTRRVKARVRMRGAGASGGTIASFLNLVSDPRKAVQMMDPLLLVPEEAKRGGAAGAAAPVSGTGSDYPLPLWDADVRAYTGMFMMAPVNTRVVRRSAALWGLAGERYSGPETSFEYSEAMSTSSWFKGAVTTLGTVVVGTLAAIPGVSWCFRRWVPQPGEGPSAAVRAKSKFEYTLVAEPEVSGTAASGGGGGGGGATVVPSKVFATVTGGDPGYTETAKMVAESALCLVLHRDTLPAMRLGGGGIFTPATAFGSVLVERLQRAELAFRVGGDA